MPYQTIATDLRDFYILAGTAIAQHTWNLLVTVEEVTLEDEQDKGG